MRQCSGCKFCCWSFAIEDIPDDISGLKFKPSLQHCQHECLVGCAIHDQKKYPPACKAFICPYLKGEDIHRPDIFQKVLQELNGNISNYIPSIPTKIPVEEAEKLIRRTRNILASILTGNEWVQIVLPLDREKDGSWTSNEDAVQEWRKLYHERS